MPDATVLQGHAATAIGDFQPAPPQRPGQRQETGRWRHLQTTTAPSSLAAYATLDYREYDVRRISRCGNGGSALGGRSSSTLRRHAGERECRREAELPASPRVGTHGREDDYGFLTAATATAAAATMSRQGSRRNGDAGVGVVAPKRKTSDAGPAPPHVAQVAPDERGENVVCRTTQWTYDAAVGTWRSTSGLSVYLDGRASVVQLSLSECRALRKICVRRLQELGIGSGRPATTGDDCRSSFTAAPDRMATASATRGIVQWLKRSCQLISLAGGSQNKDPEPADGWTKQRRQKCRRSPAQTAWSHAAGTNDAATPTATDGTRRDLLPHCLRIPGEARSYMAYLERHCLSTVGLFRIGSTRRRVRELQARFEVGGVGGGDGQGGVNGLPQPAAAEEHNPHDVASLLKGFFRRLPDALLCCRLYHAFLSTRAVDDPVTRVAALRYLVAILPVPNRDLLYSLLKLLHAVSSHAEDRTDTAGNQVPGNRMDARNLAAMFGPCILRERKGEDVAADMSTVRGAKDAIDVVAEMIDNWESMFTVTKELHDEVLEQVMKTDPTGASFLLHTKAVASKYGSSKFSEANAFQDGGNYVELAEHKICPFGAVLNRGLSTASGSLSVRTADWLAGRSPDVSDGLASSSGTTYVDCPGGLAFYHRTTTARSTPSGGSVNYSCDFSDGTGRAARWGAAAARPASIHGAAAEADAASAGGQRTAATRLRSLTGECRLAFPEAVTYV